MDPWEETRDSTRRKPGRRPKPIKSDRVDTTTKWDGNDGSLKETQPLNYNYATVPEVLNGPDYPSQDYDNQTIQITDGFNSLDLESRRQNNITTLQKSDGESPYEWDEERGQWYMWQTNRHGVAEKWYPPDQPVVEKEQGFTLALSCDSKQEVNGISMTVSPANADSDDDNWRKYNTRPRSDGFSTYRKPFFAKTFQFIPGDEISVDVLAHCIQKNEWTTEKTCELFGCAQYKEGHFDLGKRLAFVFYEFRGRRGFLLDVKGGLSATQEAQLIAQTKRYAININQDVQVLLQKEYRDAEWIEAEPVVPNVHPRHSQEAIFGGLAGAIICPCCKSWTPYSYRCMNKINGMRCRGKVRKSKHVTTGTSQDINLEAFHPPDAEDAGILGVALSAGIGVGYLAAHYFAAGRLDATMVRP